jgi:hypothetical protein
MTDLVRSLIDAERVPMPRVVESMTAPPSVHPTFIPLSPGAQYEDLGRQQVMLSAVLAEGSESWRTEIRALEGLMESASAKIRRLEASSRRKVSIR